MITAGRTNAAEISPRGLSLRQGAAYVGVSYWTFRDWVLAGHIPIIEPWPLTPRDGDRPKQTLRRVLVDRQDLDRLIDARKRQSAGVLANG